MGKFVAIGFSADKQERLERRGGKGHVHLQIMWWATISWCWDPALYLQLHLHN